MVVFATLVCSALLGLLGVMPYDSPHEVLAAADRAIRETRTFACKVSLVTAADEPGEARRISGEMMLKRVHSEPADDGTLGWKLYFGEFPREGVDDRLHVACDGFAIRSFQKTAKTILEKNVRDAGGVLEFLAYEKVEGLFPISAMDPRGYGADATVTLEAPVTLDGVECDVLFMHGELFARRIAIARTDHLPRSITEFTRPPAPSGAKPFVFEVRSVATYTNVRTDAAIADSSFLMDVPDEYTVQFPQPMPGGAGAGTGGSSGGSASGGSATEPGGGSSPTSGGPQSEAGGAPPLSEVGGAPGEGGVSQGGDN
ncbi:MAG TPA: hypothetical protein VK176_14510, partial [Phycisphaerales bacterium]|nr:hypothetical protein [Phycisphaerales bacterium]